jgi:hypothetical protein
MTTYMLTTLDNPYNPHTSFDEWYAWDTNAGYYTASFLARIVITSEDLSEADQSLAIQQGIDEIVKENVLGIYRKITQEEVVVPVPQS